MPTLFHQSVKASVFTGLLAATAAIIPLLAPPAAHSLTVCVPSPSPVPAYNPNASCLVEVGGEKWEIKTTKGEFGESGIVNGINLLETPWWSSPYVMNPPYTGSVNEWVLIVGASLGYPNFGDLFGPYFAISEPVNPSLVRTSFVVTLGGGAAAGSFGRSDPNNVWAYAVRREHVPGPLPILGVAAAFGYSRKLRKRIKTIKTPEVISAIG